MIDTYNVSNQLVEDSSRAKRTFPSEGYTVIPAREAQLQDSITLGASEVRTLWERLSTDTPADDWALLSVEALSLGLQLTLELEDALNVPTGTYEIPLVVGLPFQLGSRIMPTTVLSYVSAVKVTAPLTPGTGVRMAFLR